MGRRAFRLLFAILILALGIYRFIDGSAKKAEYDGFMSKAVAVSAVCTNVWDYETTDDDGYSSTNTFADASYEYNGEEYTAKGLSVAFNQKEGDTVTIYINPDNPSETRQQLKSGGFDLELKVAKFFIGAGVIIILIYIVSGIISLLFRGVRRR